MQRVIGMVIALMVSINVLLTILTRQRWAIGRLVPRMTIYGVLLIIAIGLVFAGLMHSLWPILTGKSVDLELLFEPSPIFPLNALAVVTSAPLLLLQAGMMRLTVPGGIFFWWTAFAAAMALCFVQGVVVVVSLGIVG